MLLSLIIVHSSSAETITFKTYIPSPISTYQQLRLEPRATMATPCQPGTLFVDSSSNNQIRFCSAAGSWGSLGGGIWTQAADDIYLADTSTPEDKKVGIGTITPEFKLTLSGDAGIIAKGTFGSGADLTTSGAGVRFIWYPQKAALRAGAATAMAGSFNDVNIGNYSVGLGLDPFANGLASSILGGSNNYASGDYSVVGGGNGNQALADYSNVLGGDTNIIMVGSATHSFIGGGSQNINNGAYSVIGGGSSNTMNSGNYMTILGGANNDCQINNNCSIGGGANNDIQTHMDGTDSEFATIIGGRYNTIQSGADYSVIGGGGGAIDGAGNQVQGPYSTIIGGTQNDIENGIQYSTIGGGINHYIQNDYSVIIGGNGGAVSANYGAIAGGHNNQASGEHSFVGSGENNQITGAGSSIAGGVNNSISTSYSFIGGGVSNQVTSFSVETYSSIPGGELNSTQSEYTWVGGKNMNLSRNNSFLWGYDDAGVNFPIGSDTFLIWGAKVGIGRMVFMATETTILEVASSAANPSRIRSDNGDICTGSNICLDAQSDRRLKENIEPLSGALERLVQLQGVTFQWNHTGLQLTADSLQSGSSLGTSGSYNEPRVTSHETQATGFIAQAVAPVFPQWVKEGVDGYKILDMRGIDAVIVESVREVNDKVDAHQAYLKDKLTQTDQTIAQLELLLKQ